MRIKNPEQLEAALARLDALWAVREGDEGWAERVALVEAIAEYEDREAEPAPPDPIDAIKFRMEQLGLRQKDLVQYIGSKSKVSEVLNGKRQLSKGMIAKLHEGLGIPLASLHGIEPSCGEMLDLAAARSHQSTTTRRAGFHRTDVRSFGAVTFTFACEALDAA